jgi:hypothetical protein
MKSQTLGSREYPGIYAVITVPDEVELPARLEVRLPEKDYESVVLWWHYDGFGNDTRTVEEGKGRSD